jgi:heat shock protein HtpX
MPKVYVIQDGAINAFATGRDPQHASIAVTTGLLQKTEKLELEGVIAHELSHIGNYDTRLMMVTAVLVGLIAILVDVMLRFTWYGAGHRKRYKGKGEGGAGAIVLIVAIVALVLAPIVSRFIQLAVSRQREYLADASSALLTRYPAGLAGALEKISKDDDPLDVATKGTAHLFIANPFKGNESSLNSLFQTHPLIEDRIARLRGM